MAGYLTAVNGFPSYPGMMLLLRTSRSRSACLLPACSSSSQYRCLLETCDCLSEVPAKRAPFSSPCSPRSPPRQASCRGPSGGFFRSKAAAVLALVSRCNTFLSESHKFCSGAGDKGDLSQPVCIPKERLQVTGSKQHPSTSLSKLIHTCLVGACNSNCMFADTSFFLVVPLPFVGSWSACGMPGGMHA